MDFLRKHWLLVALAIAAAYLVISIAEHPKVPPIAQAIPFDLLLLYGIFRGFVRWVGRQIRGGN